MRQPLTMMKLPIQMMALALKLCLAVQMKLPVTIT